MDRNDPGRGDRGQEALGGALEPCIQVLRRNLRMLSMLQALRDPVRDLASTARQAGVPPERLLTAFKAMLRAERLGAGLPGTEQEQLRERAVSLLIQEYYAGIEAKPAERENGD